MIYRAESRQVRRSAYNVFTTRPVFVYIPRECRCLVQVARTDLGHHFKFKLEGPVHETALDGTPALRASKHVVDEEHLRQSVHSVRRRGKHIVFEQGDIIRPSDVFNNHWVFEWTLNLSSTRPPRVL